MKQRETCSGRGCESPQVHHKSILYFYDGPDLDSTGQQVN